jgi:hypothetical protein
MIKVNYLNNKDLLIEIHKSKVSYSYFTKPEYSRYDAIVTDLKEINAKLIKVCREKRIKDKLEEIKQQQKAQGKKLNQIKLPELLIEDIDVETLVFRVMTYDHIPLDPERKANPRNVAEAHAKCNFPPFKHYVIDEYRVNRRKDIVDTIFIEVGRSHWKGGLERGHFTTEAGAMTNKLAMMFLKLVDKYGQRGNWRGYTYLDEMKGQALLQLSTMGLQFDESRSNNPFAYFTTALSNAFTRVFNIEKRNQIIRDDLFVVAGQTPSYTRQVEDAIQQRNENEKVDK